MSVAEDTLLELDNADRVHYSTGVLLNADDFQAEQDYHRGRLARSLAYLAGSGTVAGLRVVHEPAVAPDDDAGIAGREERLLIEPGLALDRLGRMIEVKSPLCIRLNRWYESEPAQDVNDAFHAAPVDGVITDLFIRFAACENGKTPAFSAGAFDSIGAVTAARIRDAFEAGLVLREEADPPLPQSPWPDFNAFPEVERRERLHDAVLDAWREGSEASDSRGLDLLAEHVVGQDPTDLFLARITIAATEPTPGERPERAGDAAVTVDNDVRPFVFPLPALARWLGI